MTSEISLTVIICTYNRADLLRYCLDSLVSQEDGAFHVVVVNNQCTDHTSDVVKEFANRLVLNEIEESRQGLSFARNTGYLSSKTDWVAYLDDDAKARKDWVKQIKVTIATKKFDVFGGIYVPWYLEGKVKWFRDDYGSNRRFFKEKGSYKLAGRQFISGGNAVYRRTDLLASNGFPTHLGMTGEIMRYGEEIVLQKELERKGLVLGINTSMIIDHLVPKYKQVVFFFLDSAKSKGEVYWEDRSRSFFVLVFFCLQGCLSITFRFFSGLFKLLLPSYYSENFRIDVLGKFYLYKEAFKNF